MHDTTTDLILVQPSSDMEQAIWDYRQEFLNRQENRINGSCGLHTFEAFDTWLQSQQHCEQANIQGWRPCQHFFLHPAIRP